VTVTDTSEKGLESLIMIVVTDRQILDDQIQRTVKQFMQVGATVGCVKDTSGVSKTEQLRKFIASGKKIIISTVQTFPFVLDVIGDEHHGKNFAIIIDEAHSSQGGKTSAAMSAALADPEDTVNDALEKRMAARKMLANASYFAFTATPKPKTLQMFGKPLPPDAEGKVKHDPFHSYTMKQAIQEGFILDVLKSYTPVDSYYKLVKKIEGDPEFDVKKAHKKLRKYVESHDHAIRLKSEIMVDHFHNQVMALDSYRVEKKAIMKIAVADENAQIDPVPVDAGGHKREPELDRLSNILKTFNEHFKTLFTDSDRVFKRIKDDIAPKVAANQPYLNAKQNTPHTARIAHDKALEKVMQVFLKDDTEVYKQFVENEGFRRFVTDMVYTLTNA